MKTKTVSLKAQAVRLLARREYARAELESRLAATGAARDEVRDVLDELTAVGLLSDERYARSITNQKAGRASSRNIASSLKAKGVGGDTIASAIAEAGIDDEAALVALWQRRFGRVPVDDREKARQVRFLQARGFSVSAILQLLRREGAAKT